VNLIWARVILAGPYDACSPRNLFSARMTTTPGRGVISRHPRRDLYGRPFSATWLDNWCIKLTCTSGHDQNGRRCLPYMAVRCLLDLGFVWRLTDSPGCPYESGSREPLLNHAIELRNSSYCVQGFRFWVSACVSEPNLVSPSTIVKDNIAI
jgi:hypothetical protein